MESMENHRRKRFNAIYLREDVGNSPRGISLLCQGCEAGELSGTGCIKIKNAKCWLNGR